MNQTEANTIFQAYYKKKLQLAGAVLPEEKLAVLDEMEHELVTGAVIPITEDRTAGFVASHPVYQAILNGETVNVSGESLGKKQGGVSSQSNGVKFAILGAVFLLPILIGVFFIFGGGGDPEGGEEVAAVKNIEITETIVPTVTPLPTVTPIPTVAPVVVIQSLATPTPSESSEIQGVRGSVAPSQGDPASIEFANHSFILATGEIKNGVWNPRGAEWLVGTAIRRVIAIPHEDQLESILLDLQANGFDNQKVRLRLRSGEVVTYTIDEIGWYRRDQIEILTSDRPSVVVVLSKGNEKTDEQRFIISGSVEPVGGVTTN